MQNSTKILATVIFLITISGCSQATEKSEVNNFDSFQIYIGEWNKTVTEANLGYTVESSWSLLKDWYPKGATFTIENTDIDNYDWDKHVLTLTPKASSNFQSAFETHKFMLAFVVTVNDEPLYGGLFMFHPSAMNISFPVIYEDSVDDKITFTIRPRHDVFDNYKPSDNWHGIDNPTIKDVLFKAGKIN